MAERYEPASFEAKWRERWREADLFRTREEPGRPKFYGLDFFPYPSGAGLSVGHCRNYVPTDVICRMKSMQGYNVLHPMGFDAFGLPAENEAIKRKRNPAEMIAEYTATYRRQMELIGVSYDWSRSFASCDPDFVRGTQWIFQLLHKRGLAYRKLAPVNWCPKDKTALANEEVVGGLCERCGTPVEKREIPQWYFRITEYAQRLIDDLDTIDWPEGIKLQQRNWIGRSEGVEFSMRVVVTEETARASRKRAMPQEPAPERELTELEILEQEVRAGGHQPPPPKTDIELKAIGHMRKAESLAQDAMKTRYGAQNLFDAASAKIHAAGGTLPRSEQEPHIQVFTTRIDTVYGVTFCVVAPEHPIVEVLLARVAPDRKEAIVQYRESAKGTSSAERQNEGREKTGVFTGAYAVNPVNDELVPLWIADYVLMDYGTGAIMAVPGHDQRDFDFAVKFGLEVLPVVKPTEAYLRAHTSGEFDFDTELARYCREPKSFLPVFVSKESVAFNSGIIDGLGYEDATRKLAEWFENQGIGTRKVQFKLRDWLISRQRYWGCPIPIVHTSDSAIELVPESDLPVLLPEVENYEPGEDGQSPLARIESWVQTKDHLGRPATRETDTMGGFADSSWYFLRFCDPDNQVESWSQEKARAWMPVDCYVGGAEHAVMHLLYARFWTKVLHDEGLTHVKEPFQRLENQGQVLALTPYRRPREGEVLEIGDEGILVSFEEAAAMPEDEVFWRWSRMSKSKGNVVTPDEAVAAYGADALRLYLLFVAPFNQDVQWDNKGMEGPSRFLSRVFRLVSDHKAHFSADWRTRIASVEMSAAGKALRQATHQAIAKASDDIDRFAFNTYVSTLMSFSNVIAESRKDADSDVSLNLAMSEAVETLILLLAPGAPHSADELWETLSGNGFTLRAAWPVSDPALAARTTVTVAIQVNGKLRDTIDLPADAASSAMESAALASEKVKPFVDGKTVRKVVVVPGRLVNIVAN